MLTGRRRTLLRFVIGGLCCALVMSGYALFWGPQTLAFVEAGRLGHKFPETYVTPEALPPIPPDNSPGTKLSYYGYSCELPWVDVARERKVGPFTAVVFRSGQMIWFPDPQSRSTLQVLSRGDAQTEQNISLMVGNNVRVSDEVLKSRILYATPTKFSLFMDRKEAVAESMLLLWKSMSFASDVGHIYRFQVGDKHGFQVGDPEKTRYVELDLFKSDGREVPFTIVRANGPAGEVSQAQINRILETLKIGG